MSFDSQELTQNVIPSLETYTNQDSLKENQQKLLDFVAPRPQLMTLANSSVNQTPNKNQLQQINKSEENNEKTPKYTNYNLKNRAQNNQNVTQSIFRTDQAAKPLKKINLKIQAQPQGTDELGFSNLKHNLNSSNSKNQRKISSQSYISDFNLSNYSNTEVYDQTQEESQIRKINNVIANHLENSRMNQTNSFTSIRSACSSQQNAKTSIASLAYILKDIQDPTILYSLSNAITPKLKKEISNISGIQDYLDFLSNQQLINKSNSSDPESIQRRYDQHGSDIHDIIETLQALQTPQQKNQKIKLQQSSKHQGDKILINNNYFDEDQIQSPLYENKNHNKSKSQIAMELKILKEGIILAAEKILSLRQQNNQANSQIETQNQKINQLEENFKIIQQKQMQDIDSLKVQISAIQKQPQPVKQSKIVPVKESEELTSQSAQVTQNANVEIQCNMETKNDKSEEKKQNLSYLIKHKQSKCGDACKCVIF